MAQAAAGCGTTSASNPAVAHCPVRHRHNMHHPACAHRLPAAQQLHELDAVGLQRQSHQLEGVWELQAEVGRRSKQLR